MVFALLVTDQPERATSHDPQSKILELGPIEWGSTSAASRARENAVARPQPSGHGGQS
jgi:hypothetical protein